MDCDKIIFTIHALRRMFERSIGKDDVIQAIREGEVIREYPDDTPHPSCLILQEGASRPLHVMVARDDEGGECTVVTVYLPDLHAWMPDFEPGGIDAMRIV